MVITLVVIVVALLVAAAVTGYVLERRRRDVLQQRFGPEYDRAVGEAGNRRRRGERELVLRQKRHEQLDIRPLDPERAQDYAAEWEAAQTRFVDDPHGAVRDADTVIEALMAERGYPVDDFDTRVADLSVEHAEVLQHYRAAHEIATAAAAGDADTEALRRAMVHYRALFTALLEDRHERTAEDGSVTSRRIR